jgi:hypothetical protein
VTSIPKSAPKDLVAYWEALRDGGREKECAGLTEKQLVNQLVFDKRIANIWPKLRSQLEKQDLDQDRLGEYVCVGAWRAWCAAHEPFETPAAQRKKHRAVEKACAALQKAMENAGPNSYPGFHEIIAELSELARSSVGSVDDRPIAQINRGDAKLTAFVVTLGRFFKRVFGSPLYIPLTEVINVTWNAGTGSTDELSPEQVQYRLRSKL